MPMLKYFAAFLPILIHAAPQAAISDIPSCAYQPLLAALSGTACASTDIACICAQTGLIPTITSTVVDACPGSVSTGDVAVFIAELCGGSVTSSTVATMTDGMGLATNAANATTTTTGAATTANGTVSSEPTVMPTAQPSDGGAEGLRMSLMAGVVAFGGLTWAFAEL